MTTEVVIINTRGFVIDGFAYQNVEHPRGRRRRKDDGSPVEADEEERRKKKEGGLALSIFGSGCLETPSLHHC